MGLNEAFAGYGASWTGWGRLAHWQGESHNRGFANLLDETGKEALSIFVEGCGCAACQAYEEGKLFQPGSGGSGAEDTIPGSTATTAVLTPGSFQTSAIDSAGDSDWFSITLTAGQTYVFSTYLGGGGLSDSILTLRSSTGAVIATNDDANTGANLLYSEITFTATASGTYYLDVTGYGGDTGDYFVSS